MTNDGLVVDANIMNYYIQEKRKEDGELYKLIESIIYCCGLAINDTVEREWRNTNKGQFFDIWFDELMLDQRIKYVTDSNKLTSHQKRQIHNEFGLPRNKSKDIDYIECAINTEIKYILTDDTDFFDPKKKKASSKEKIKVKNQRQGAFCKFLKKEFGIIVGLPDHCYEDLQSKGVITEAI
jgi:predicted nucleic acid-binding protein